MALMENRPAWQGLVQKSMTMLHLEMCGVNGIKWVHHPDMIHNGAWPGRH